MAKGGGGINIVLSADAEALKRGLAEAKAALSKTADSAIADQQRMAAAAQKFTQQAANAGTLKQQGRALQNLAYSYSQMGEAGKKAMKDTLQAARENKDAQEDLQFAVQAGTIEGKFQVAAKAMQEVITVMAGVKGAMMAFGMSGEDAQESIAKLQGMMAFSQGIGALIGLDGYVKALVPSFAAATAAMTGFKAALVSTGIGALVVGLGFAITAMIDYIDTSDDVEAASKRQRNEQERLAKVLDNTHSRWMKHSDLELLRMQAMGATEEQMHKRKIGMMAVEISFMKQKGMDADKLRELEDAKEKEQLQFQIDQQRKLEDATKQHIQRRLSDSKEAYEVEILQLKAKGATTDDLLNAEQAWRMRDLSLAKSIGAEKDAIRQREVDLEKFKLQRIIDETAWAQEQIKTIMDEGPALRPKSAAMAQMFGAMNEAQWTNLMRTNRKFFEQMKSQDVSNFKEYIRSFYTEYEAAAKSFDPKTFTDAMMPPDAPEKINIGYKKIMGVDNANHNARVRQQTAQVNAMNQGLQQGLAQGTDAFEQFVSDMVQGDKMAGKNFGNALLGAVAGFMSTLGKAMIAAAVASDTFQKALLTQPAAAIVAGVALVAAAGVVKGLMKKGMGANQGGGGGNNSGGPEGIRRFASGGIISGPTIGMMGEYPGAKSNPEVVAPLDKLKNIIGTSGSQGGELVTRISGQDLLIMLDRAETYRGRVR